MRKQNLSFKQIGKQILSINTLIESYFNRLRQFVLNLKNSLEGSKDLVLLEGLKPFSSYFKNSLYSGVDLILSSNLTLAPLSLPVNFS